MKHKNVSEAGSGAPVLYYAFVFCSAVLMMAGLWGFGAAAVGTAVRAKPLFFIFLILFLATFVAMVVAYAAIRAIRPRFFDRVGTSVDTDTEL